MQLYLYMISTNTIMDYWLLDVRGYLSNDKTFNIHIQIRVIESVSRNMWSDAILDSFFIIRVIGYLEYPRSKPVPGKCEVQQIVILPTWLNTSIKQSQLDSSCCFNGTLFRSKIIYYLNKESIKLFKLLKCMIILSTNLSIDIYF